MRENWVRYEDIEEKRNGYYVEYSPVFTGQDFANLVIYIHDRSLNSQIGSIVDCELKVWAKKYPTPILTMVKTLEEGVWKIRELGSDYSLLSYVEDGKIVHYDDSAHDSSKPNFDLSKEKLSQIYSGLSYRTLGDVIKKQNEQAKGRKLLLVMLTFWFCVVPALIAYLGWSSQLFALMALAYSWYKAYKKARELWGIKKKSPSELQKQKEQLEKDHHHYHCKKNPEAFLRLKIENFKNDEVAKNKSKIDSMYN
ncbi:hypothetical protein MZJ28_001368 [Vibrio parahaemolyticus]|uniref:hypothetical protein n=1 Tax=Vibrio parahaemolyticus TaxID=670 RepID=UPI000B781BED|nr:hypothetical protein [Vibrio parahaemolyticus]EGQ9994046.1 hypothetical protein [Vibrio vulnificus]EGQ8137022.1 hypothetical protein [Vibrio parahaemolyticus]EGQ8148744.1 hypothetical protein [Vibrio parahaemolyticus]EGQ8250590.1 hypothetical protein [Vibrio parahaemolyticus]EGQ8265071.1 hypothetical protein [Vibrio parahaemolyticus]